MTGQLERKSIPSRLRGKEVSGNESDTIIGATRRFVEGLVAGDYLYDGTDDPNSTELSGLIRRHVRAGVMHSPENIGLLHTNTYKNPSFEEGGGSNLGLDMRNPRMAEKIRSFGIGKREGNRTEKERRAFMQWLKKTLLISVEAAEKNPDHVEQIATQYITDAIVDIRTTLIDPLREIVGDYGRSGYYDSIYREGITAYELLCLARKHFKSYRHLSRKNNPTDKELRARNDHNKAMYEIARIFGFVSMYIDINHVPGKGTCQADKVFLVSEVLKIANIQTIPDASNIIDMVNPFYESTDTVRYYWKKEGDKYTYAYPKCTEDAFDTYIEQGYTEGKFESITFFNTAEEKEKKVKVLHIDFRHEKKTKSTAHKILRKGLASPREVLDMRGFRFVVNSKEDANILLDILVQRLTTGPERAWSESPTWQTNSASGNNFKCFKGTLNVVHKRPPKETYILETEIQVFIGTDSYIAAHCDKESPSYVDNYKNEQYLQESLLVYPPAIFPRAHERILKKLTERRVNEILQRINEENIRNHVS